MLMQVTLLGTLVVLRVPRARLPRLWRRFAYVPVRGRLVGHTIDRRTPSEHRVRQRTSETRDAPTRCNLTLVGEGAMVQLT